MVRSSADDEVTYTVRMESLHDSNVPSCECPDWTRRGLPCKHLLAVIMTRAADGWNSLPETDVQTAATIQH